MQAMFPGAFPSSTHATSASICPVGGRTGARRNAPHQRHEQSDELGSLFSSAHGLLNTLVVVDGSLRTDQLIGPTVPYNLLAAAIAECRQIRIVCSNYTAELFYRLIKKRSYISGVSVVQSELGILRQEIAEPLQRKSERLSLERRSPATPQCSEIRSARQPYQRKLPSLRRGPSQSFRIRFASASVKDPQSPADVPISALGSYVQRDGSSMTLSLTPSMESAGCNHSSWLPPVLHRWIALFSMFMSMAPTFAGGGAGSS
jgi:hypothetical protein